MSASCPAMPWGYPCGIVENCIDCQRKHTAERRLYWSWFLWLEMWGEIGKAVAGGR